ncbi:hypothetical protein GE061_014513 [Apolygus lucorum]|uniref:Uncharacterized protein n=1 Tax=Apolygus lucorum TaxID=248454 RepID=A0A8S9XIF0_APOLU|nr:hypothetical protein GE061_014513 [Apolygus lucorum]
MSPEESSQSNQSSTPPASEPLLSSSPRRPKQSNQAESTRAVQEPVDQEEAGLRRSNRLQQPPKRLTYPPFQN